MKIVSGENLKLLKTSKLKKEMKKNGALLVDDDFTLDRLSQFFSGEFSYNCKGGAFDLSINNYALI